MKIVVVGAGVSGAHAALTLLERSFEVELWDVGREEEPHPAQGIAFNALKGVLRDPVEYFLGADFSALIPPASGELLHYPPSRNFLTSNDDPLWEFESETFFPYGSHNKGGLANGWGANALSFDDNDLADWPIGFSDMEQAYKTVYRRIPVAGPTDDDLAPYLSGVYPSQSPVRLSAADQRMLQGYHRKRRALEKLGIRIGAARLAVITDPQRAHACDYCDRCLWGCPRASIYNPALTTLKECERYKGFRYVQGRQVLSLVTGEGKITGIRYLNTSTRQIHEDTCDVVFLAAGALQSGAVFLRTLKTARLDTVLETEGLMDTTVVKLPFVALNSIGSPTEPRTFQFNRLLIGLVNGTGVWPRYLHGELLHLTSLLYHPLIESLPVDSRFSKRLFFALKSALGTASLFFPDKVVSGNRQVLMEGKTSQDTIQLFYQASNERNRYIRRSIARIRAGLWRLGCLPKGTIQSPPGAGIHYAGTIPMGKGAKRCDPAGRSNLFSNLYIADGAAFPSLPSKSITVSLAAHATRVVRRARL